MTQTEMVLDYIQKHGAITPLEALTELGCMRLGARVWELRHAGLPIERAMVEAGGKRFAKYYLTKEHRPAGGTAERGEGEDHGGLPS